LYKITNREITMKTIKYKGEKIIKPDNLSLNCLKRFIDNLGYSSDVQEHINFWAKEISGIERKFLFPTFDNTTTRLRLRKHTSQGDNND
jgi:hypothetical protein